MKRNIFDSKSKENKLLVLCSSCIMGLLLLLFSILYIIYDKTAYLSAAITFGTMLYHFLMRLSVGYLTMKYIYPRLNYNSRWFRTSSAERKIYSIIKVRKWKVFMPTANPESFSLKKHTPEEIAKTMCGSEVVHELNILFSFMPLFLAIPFGTFSVFLITSVAAALADLPFVIMQRFNRPRLLRFASRQK